MDFQWYIVKTFTNHEQTAKKNLEERILQSSLKAHFERVVVPTEKISEIRSGKKRQRWRNFYPGYVLIKMILTDQTYMLVKGTEKIVSFLSKTAVAPAEIKTMLLRIEAGGKRPQIRTAYEVGDQIKITSGTFENCHGEVEYIDLEQEKLRVRVNVHGRPNWVELDFKQIRRF